MRGEVIGFRAHGQRKLSPNAECRLIGE
jgi:hypothetical protein